MALAVLLLLLFVYTNAYLPGLVPINYCIKRNVNDHCDGPSKVPVFVNRLDSTFSVITHEYHDFDFCLGAETTETPVENIGQTLFGERIRPSPYDITFLKDEKCKLLCATKVYSSANADSVKKFNKLLYGIKNGYTHHWIVDNLPVLFCPSKDDGSACLTGFPMGIWDFQVSAADKSVEQPNNYIFNHIDFYIEYRDLRNDSNFFGNNNGGRIISVKAVPFSIFRAPGQLTCDETAPMFLPAKLNHLSITYTYSVHFVKTDIKWASRWDYLFRSNQSTKILWFGISNSILIAFFLTIMIGIILLRTLRHDIARYNQFYNSDDVQEEFGWKLVHGDVFRPPRHCILLSVFVGSGVQILSMALVTLVFSFVGIVSPARRGSMVTSLVVLYVLFGFVNGYISARIYKTIGGARWKTNVFLSCLLCPGIIFSVFFICNVILTQQGSSAAVSNLTLLLLLFLWLGISLPLTFIGAYYGFRKPRPAFPVRTNQIPRQIPPQPFLSKPFPSMFMAGALPFGCIYVQLFFIFNSIWAHQVYYMVGFLLWIFLILLVTLAETSIVICYFQLCGEDYRWWWRAFLSSGCTAGYLLFYCVYFFFYKLELTGLVSFVLYFSYCFIIVFIFFLLCGAIGFLSCYWFVKKIYSVVKVD